MLVQSLCLWKASATLTLGRLTSESTIGGYAFRCPSTFSVHSESPEPKEHHWKIVIGVGSFADSKVSLEDAVKQVIEDGKKYQEVQS